MRYDTEFLLECLLLRIKSSKAYNHLIQHKLLPLPCISTIRRLLSCMPCSFGLNSFALNAIKQASKGKKAPFLYGSLVCDEMSVTEEADFNAQTLITEGFVNYVSR